MALFSKKQPTNDTFVVPLPETPAEVRRRRIISIVLIIILLAILVWAIIAIHAQSKDSRAENNTNGDSTISQPATTDNNGVNSTDERNDSDSSTGSTDNSSTGNESQTALPESTAGNTGTDSSANSSTALPATGDMLAN